MNLAVVLGGSTFLFFSGLGVGYYLGLAQIEKQLEGIVDVDMSEMEDMMQDLEGDLDVGK